MTAQDRLNLSARAHGWANWSEVLMHNAPAHVINLIVEDAMRGEPVNSVENRKPALTWRPGARVRITGDNMYRHCFAIDTVLIAEGRIGEKGWYCKDEFGLIRVVAESDAVVVG